VKTLHGGQVHLCHLQSDLTNTNKIWYWRSKLKFVTLFLFSIVLLYNKPCTT